MTVTQPDFTKQHNFSRRTKLLYAFSYVIISIAIVLILLIAFWLLFPYETSDIDTPINILNENEQIAPGEPIKMQLTIKKKTNLAPSSEQFIICSDGSLTFVDPGNPRNLPPGNYKVVSDTNLLPAKLIPGSRCSYHFRNTYKVNPLKSVIKEWATEQFLVVRR